MIELLRPALGSTIDIAARADPATLPIKVDVAELELALLNLAINANDAMPGAGELEISAGNAPPGVPDASQGQVVAIAFRDKGSGIPPELVDRVFEPFFTTKPADHGTGLGRCC